jgi:hypothetical protein
VFEAMWSININVGTILVTRCWDSYRGPVAQELTRVLYGTTWTAMLGAESLVAALVSGGRFGWADGAKYWTTWLVGTDVPSGCAKTGASGGCGVGVGSFGGLAFRVNNTHVWLEASGGWIEQRVSTDDVKTLSESTWMMTPLHAYYEARHRAGPFGVRGELGPSVDFGMHNAHMHRRAGHELRVDRLGSWTELFPLDGGIGGGFRALGQIDVKKLAFLEAELRFSPLFLGAANEHPDSELGPMSRERSAGIPIFRQVNVGAATYIHAIPARIGLHYFAAELSTRKITDLGHHAVMVKYEFPLRGSF